MNQRSSALARAMAATALVVGFVVLTAVIATSLGGEGSNGSREGTPASQVTRKSTDGERPKKGSYVVQSGDTLTSIAHRTGVPIARIQELNPGVDPRILVSGEKLKLR